MLPNIKLSGPGNEMDLATLVIKEIVIITLNLKKKDNIPSRKSKSWYLV